jgi:hypothetical protein
MVLRRIFGFAGSLVLAGWLLVGTSAGAASPAASLTRWSPLAAQSPTGLTSNGLDGVACWSPGSCVAVGYSATEPGQPGLIEDLGPTGWALAPTPAPPGSYRSQLNAVSCASADFCVAVGYYQDNARPAEPLVETWNGSSWSVTAGTGPGKGGNYLTGVSCPVAGACVAVGYYSNLRADQVLAETLAGGTWSLSPAANLGYGSNELRAVSCGALGSCYAVGYYKGPAGADQVLVEAFSNGSWTVAPAPDQGARANRLEGVSCPAAGTCEAVGSYYNGHAYQSLAEALTVGTWSLQKSPDASVANNELDGVSCPAPGTCEAVGFYSNGSSQQPLVAALSAGAWHKQTGPGETGTGNALAGVTCPATGTCSAVGAYTVAGVSEALAMNLSGSSWSLVSAAGQDAPQASLSAVSCPAPTNCVAVGWAPGGTGAPEALAETYTGGSGGAPGPGGSFSVAAAVTPPGAEASYLSGVSCPAVGSCVAVGYEVDAGGVPQALAETESGGSWSLSALPLPSAAGSYLSGVSCPAVGSCMAVGYDVGAGGAVQALVESYASGAWSVAPTPLPTGAKRSYLAGVSCPSPATCVAVGYYTMGATALTLVEGLSGGSWSVEPSAEEGSGANALTAVSCGAVTSCYAVGYYQSQGSERPLVETVTGAAGPATLSSAPDRFRGSLSGVSCAAASACAAVGYSVGRSAQQSLAEVRSKASWAVVPTYNSSSLQQSGLAGVSCAGTTCVAVGSYQDGSARLALAEYGHLVAPAPSAPTTTTTTTTPPPATTGSTTTTPVTTTTTRPAAPKQVATSTRLASRPNPSVQGHIVTYTALVRPVPRGGKVAFTDNGVALSRCRAVPLSATGKATCSVSYSSPGDHVVEALYSGSARFTSSASGPYSQLVAAPPPLAQGYWLATRRGGVFAAGAARHLGGIATSAKDPVVAIAAAPDGNGYWVATADGAVRGFGSARYFGDLPRLKVHVDDIVAIAPSPDGRGYWLVGRDGGLFAFGDAAYHGSLVARHLRVSNIVGVAAVPGGYLLATSGGGILTFGKAHYYGSLPARKVHTHDIKAIVAAPRGDGYLLVGAGGGVFTFGRGAHFYGSLPAEHVRVSDIVGMALTPDHRGYFLAGSNGAVYGFGDASARPMPRGLAAQLPVVALAGR